MERVALHSCPGSVLFLFEGPHTDPKSPFSKTPNRIFRYLHCGGESPHSYIAAASCDWIERPAFALRAC